MANENERNDISLCFQALGIEFGAPPEEVEKAYQRLLAEIKRKSSSADPAARAEAANDLELAHDLYEKIRNSVTYGTRMREAEQAASLKQQLKKKAPIPQYKICPSCRKTVGIAIKKCPFCKEPIRTPFEQFINNLFSLKTLVVLVILLAVIAGVVFLINPELFKRNKATLSPEFPASSSFGNQSSSSFSNQSGAAKKP